VQARRALALVVITHDLGVVWRMAHRVLVLRDGLVHEQGLTAEVFANPASDYTRLLLSAATSASRQGQDSTLAQAANA
jgi:ABC-type microcin C transport system duplicated ATPase subunit YejF